MVGGRPDGTLNDIDAMHVRPEHVVEAIDAAAPGPVREGNVGGGTGMICHGFRAASAPPPRSWTRPTAASRWASWSRPTTAGGTACASRACPSARSCPATWSRCQPSPVRAGAGRSSSWPPPTPPCSRTSATAWPSGPGWVARTGGAGENSAATSSFAFATGNRGLTGGELTVPLRMLAGERIDPLFYAVIEATEEAIVNAMVAAETMTGRGGHRPPPPTGDRLVATMDRYRPRPDR